MSLVPWGPACLGETVDPWQEPPDRLGGSACGSPGPGAAETVASPAMGEARLQTTLPLQLASLLIQCRVPGLWV